MPVTPPATGWPAPLGGYLFQRLFLTALVAALPVVGIFAWSLVDNVRQARRAATDSVLAHSADTARRVQDTLLRLNVVADVLLARDEVLAMDAERCGAALQDLPRVDPLILNVGVFDLEGRPLCLARRLAVMPATFRESAWFRQALAHDGRLITAPYHSPASQRRVLSLVSPVRDVAGRRIGVLGLSIDLERLSAALQVERLPPGAAVGVVAADGTIVARMPEPARWIGKAVPRQVLEATPATPATAAFSAEGMDGVRRTIGSAAVGGEGWRVYTGVPTAHYTALMWRNSQRGLGVLAAALLLGALASWAGARLLARPLQRLTQTARRLAAGDENARADESLPGEAGQLGAEFNHMVRSLVASRNVERLSSERFTRLFTVIPVGAAVVDAQDQRLLEVNETFCRDHALPREAVLGRTLGALGLVLPGGAADDTLRRAAAGDEVQGLEALVRGPADAERNVLLSAAPVDWGSRAAVLVVQVDITERRQAELQRRQAERLHAASAAKTEFLSRMSHELRTPLNAILGFTQLLRMNPEGRLGEAQLRQLGLVQQAGRQLTALIDDVLDVARVEAGQVLVRPEPLDLRAFVDEALQLAEGAAREAGVRLLGPAADAPLHVLADATRLRQVLTNLLSNAVKYNRRGGEVALQLGCDGDHARLVVRDTGIGMSAQQQASLFQPFNRLGRERSAVPGTGIGLVLTRQLVQLQGGTLDVASDEGRGTTVTVRLPLARAPMAAGAPAAEDDAAPRAGRVLYVEDNATNALVVQELLKAWPAVVLEVAPDGGTGLARARAQRPDLMLLDMQLPDMSGLDVLHAVRVDPALQGLPVLCLSASAMPDDVAAARAAGADDYWAKPFDVEAFRRVLRGRLPAAA